MRDAEIIRVALVGNPNTGKSSLFNELTGLKQKVSNYPGVTVERRIGMAKISKDCRAIISDLPGTYSINPTSIDENIVLQTFLNTDVDDYPDVVVLVADVENLKRNLFLFTQIKDLEIPVILVINMADQMEKRGISIDIEQLKKELNAQVVLISTKKNIGIDQVKSAILNFKEVKEAPFSQIAERIDPSFFPLLNKQFENLSLYRSWLLLTQHQRIDIDSTLKDQIQKVNLNGHNLSKMQNRETILRYQLINGILKKTYKVDTKAATGLRFKLDKILTHKVFGYVIFASILLVIFQSIFDWASIPMDFIDTRFASFGTWVSSQLAPGVFTELITEGIIPGIGGIVIFIPQIAILFTFVAILEETGYMSRVVFLMDRIMRRFGMSGKSVVPLISGTACAIPAIMAARNISGWKERLITILVTPFITCSARLPVYAILIALIIPETRFGVFSLRGLTLMGLYLLGFAAALITAFVLQKVLKIKSSSFFVVEMPNYKLPILKNVGITVFEKTKAFVFGAGKIILALSVVLWFLASHGPVDFKNAEAIVTEQSVNTNDAQLLNQEIEAYKLENSYIGIAGKSIEPAIKPLGYDWKVGIALLTSFAAREVFVSTLATIYSVEDSEETNTIKERMAAEINPDTGKPMFNLPVGMSLMIFYAFAMQCMSTLAVVKKETNSWKWPLLQFIGMTIFAYTAAFITFQIFS
ncbi:ferrous iron transport protein B [Flavobacteriaceae bacterium F08102]|nr:ferrous iron transport protein B [Flavobacteriaceae bacterium F08102]